MSKKWKCMLMVLLLLGVSGLVFTADDYPSRPINLIVPYAAGGGSDTVARLIQQGLNKVLPEPVVVTNIGGGASVIGMRELMSAKPDGYTMGFNIINIWTNKALGTADFGPFDFEPVAQVGTYYLCMVAGSQFPYDNMAEVMEELKKNPKSLSEATNIGAIIHFSTLALQDIVGGGAEFNLVHIGDGSGRISGVLGGHVDTTTMAPHEAKPFYDSGEMKILAVFSEERIPGIPDVPTARELGIDIVSDSDYCFYMPKGTPQDRVDYMADALEKVMKDPEVVAALDRMMMKPAFLRGQALTDRLTQQGEKIMAIAEKYGLNKN